VYDSALGACKAMTVLWYAQRKQIPVDDIQATVERDDSEERQGVYRLRVTLSLTARSAMPSAPSCSRWRTSARSTS
jgi:putative redox protein